MDKREFFKKSGAIMAGTMLPRFSPGERQSPPRGNWPSILPMARIVASFRSPSMMVIDVTKRYDKCRALASCLLINNIAESNANLISPHRCWQPVSNVWPTVPCALSVAQTGFACNHNQSSGKRSKKEFRWDRAGETL